MAGSEITKLEQQGEPSWPAPDDPRCLNTSEQTRTWIEAGQPEALEVWLSGIVNTAFHALSNLAMAHGAWPKDALDNAKAQLPHGRAELFTEQLELSEKYAKDRHEVRGVEGTLEDALYGLVMKAAKLKHEPVPTD